MALVPLKRKTLIANRFEIDKKIGEGTFSIVYRAKDVVGNAIVAIKIEKGESVLLRESHALKRLQDCAFVCRHVFTGLHEERSFIAMSLLGESLSNLRHKRPGGKFSLSTVLRLGLQLIKVIRGIHELGYIHRDVKPSNFVMGSGSHGALCFAIDFGLSKYYLTPSGDVKPPRENAEFRGSSMYASVNAHLFQDLSRRDDLWSLLYLLVEFIEGDLPWRQLTEKEMVKDMKLICAKNPLKLSKGHLPEEFFEFSNYLNKLSYFDAPNYSLLISLLQKIQRKHNLQGDELFDWEDQSQTPDVLSNGHSQLSSPSSAFIPAASEIQSEKEVSEKFSLQSNVLTKLNLDPETINVSKPEDRIWNNDSILQPENSTAFEKMHNESNLNASPSNPPYLKPNDMQFQYDSNKEGMSSFPYPSTPNKSLIGDAPFLKEANSSSAAMNVISNDQRNQYTYNDTYCQENETYDDKNFPSNSYIHSKTSFIDYSHVKHPESNTALSTPSQSLPPFHSPLSSILRVPSPPHLNTKHPSFSLPLNSTSDQSERHFNQASINQLNMNQPTSSASPTTHFSSSEKKYRFKFTGYEPETPIRSNTSEPSWRHQTQVKHSKSISTDQVHVESFSRPPNSNVFKQDELPASDGIQPSTLNGCKIHDKVACIGSLHSPPKSENTITEAIDRNSRLQSTTMDKIQTSEKSDSDAPLPNDEKSSVPNASPLGKESNSPASNECNFEVDDRIQKEQTLQQVKTDLSLDCINDAKEESNMNVEKSVRDNTIDLSQEQDKAKELASILVCSPRFHASPGASNSNFSHHSDDENENEIQDHRHSPKGNGVEGETNPKQSDMSDEGEESGKERKKRRKHEELDWEKNAKKNIKEYGRESTREKDPSFPYSRSPSKRTKFRKSRTDTAAPFLLFSTKDSTHAQPLDKQWNPSSDWRIHQNENESRNQDDQSNFFSLHPLLPIPSQPTSPRSNSPHSSHNFIHSPHSTRVHPHSHTLSNPSIPSRPRSSLPAHSSNSSHSATNHSSHPYPSPPTKVRYERQIHYVIKQLPPNEKPTLPNHRSPTFPSSSSIQHYPTKKEGSSVLNKRYHDSIARKEYFEDQNHRHPSEPSSDTGRINGGRYQKDGVRNVYISSPKRSNVLHLPPNRTAVQNPRNPSDPFHITLSHPMRSDPSPMKDSRPNNSSSLNSNWGSKISSSPRYASSAMTPPKYEARNERSGNSIDYHQKDSNSSSFKSSRTSMDRPPNQRSRFHDPKRSFHVPQGVSSSHDHRRSDGEGTNKHDYEDKKRPSFHPTKR